MRASSINQQGGATGDDTREGRDQAGVEGEAAKQKRRIVAKECGAAQRPLCAEERPRSEQKGTGAAMEDGVEGREGEG
jgi:hypothetical protein